jgi:hypothetical protein
MMIKAERAKETFNAALKYPGLQNQPDNSRNRGSLHQCIRQFLRVQFGRPTGFWGNIAGKIMVHTPSNKERIHWTISLVDTRPDDRVLQIGFGPGFAIELVCMIVSEGFIAGVDHSEIMVRQARKGNARAIHDAKVVLRKLLRPGGLIAVTLQPRSRSTTEATTKEIGK